MLVKALKSFSGKNISMFEGEVKDISDKTLLSDLLNAKHIEEVKTEKKKKTSKKTPKGG